MRFPPSLALLSSSILLQIAFLYHFYFIFSQMAEETSLMDRAKPNTSELLSSGEWRGRHGLSKGPPSPFLSILRKINCLYLDFWIESIRRILLTHRVPIGDVESFETRHDLVSFNSGENPVLFLFKLRFSVI